MAEIAAHLIDHVFPPLLVRQWVLSVPKRLRWCLEGEAKAVTAMLHILLRGANSPTATARGCAARLGRLTG